MANCGAGFINQTRFLFRQQFRFSLSVVRMEQVRFRRRMVGGSSHYEEADLMTGKVNVTNRVVGNRMDFIEPIKDTEDEAEFEEDDRSSLPRYQKVNGWEKDNKHVKTMGNILNCKRDRVTSDSVVVEGVRNIRDAVGQGFIPSLVVFSRIKLLQQLKLPNRLPGCRIYHIPYSSIKLWSDLTTSPGVMAAFDKKDLAKVEASSCLPLTLVCDNVRQPDNMGAIMRVAAAAGARRLILTNGCVDPWAPKVLRASAGAHFHIPIVEGVGWDGLQNQLEDKFPQVVLLDLLDGPDGAPPDQAQLELLEKQAREAGFQNFGEQDSEAAYLDQEICDQYKALPIRTCLYKDFVMEPGFREVVVVVGGETEGVSGAAYRFCHTRHGSRLHVPLRNGINSLNVVSAASVLLFRVQQAILDREAEVEET